MVPGGLPRFLGSTVSFRSSRKVLAGGSQSFTLRLQAVRTPLLHFARSADDVGRIRRCQRSTSVAAALPQAHAGKGKLCHRRFDTMWCEVGELHATSLTVGLFCQEALEVRFKRRIFRRDLALDLPHFLKSGIISSLDSHSRPPSCSICRDMKRIIGVYSTIRG